MGVLSLLKRVVSPVTDIVDKAVTDKDLARQLKHDIEMQMIQVLDKELESKRDVIVAEAQGESWLQRSWRPILMLSFVAIIVNNYILSPYLQAMFGFEVMLEIPVDMWELLKIGVGGYIVGRSAEKGIEKWKQQPNAVG